MGCREKEQEGENGPVCGKLNLVCAVMVIRARVNSENREKEIHDEVSDWLQILMAAPLITNYFLLTYQLYV